MKKRSVWSAMTVVVVLSGCWNSDNTKTQQPSVEQTPAVMKESVGDTNTTTTDVTPPVITLNGEANVTLEQGEPYTELGATAVDAVDGNVTVSISGTVDTNTTGTYTVTYTAKDKAGNEATVTRDVSVVAPTLTGMTLESNATTLNVGERVQLFVTGTYTNGNRKKIDANISYTVTPSDKADINNGMLTAKKDGNVTVQATLDGKTSNPVTLSIYWEVNGHRLPPEPDPTVNNATLLGIDSNNNGVRDDVERTIYKTYQNKHPIHIDIGMQAARGYKLVLEYPERAKEIHEEVNSPIDCNWYYKAYAKFLNEPLLVNENIVTKIFSIYFNTKERKDLYSKYDSLLSGGTYVLPEIEDMKSKCDFDTNVYEEK